MIVRWTAAALVDLESIENYQRLHWPTMHARFEARLTAIEARIVEFPLGVEAGAIEVLAIRHASRRPLFD